MKTCYASAGGTHADRGQALVEFALVLPILLLILMGVFDLGRGIYAYNVVASAAREGARYGITSPSDTAGIRSQALANTTALDSSQLNVPAPVCSNGCSNAVAGDTIAVTVIYTFRPVTLFFRNLTLTGKSTMTIE